MGMLQGQKVVERTQVQPRRWSIVLMLMLGGLFLSACVMTIPVDGEVAQTRTAVGARITEIGNATLPNPGPVIVPDVSARVITQNSRANVRSGPSIDAPIVAKANPGDVFEVIGKSADGEWWQICCIPGPADAAGAATESAWIATVVVATEGNVEAVSDVESLFPTEISSSWRMDWSCGSERCELEACSATVTASADGEGSPQWLQVEHTVTWDDGCFPEDTWVFEVDRFTGRERSGALSDTLLFNYWLGAQPGPATNIFNTEDGRQVAVWCSGSQEATVPEDGGWTGVYEGRTCHDVLTGELVYLNYTKRWLYSGEYNGQNYERAYFGDFEQVEQYLLESSVGLAYLD
jgi:hypothetical protein